MDSRSQNDSDGGGGHHGWSPSSTSSPGTPHDERRQQPWPPQTQSGLLDAGLNNGQPPHAPVLSLDQIRITGSSNEYTEGPTVVQRSPATLQRQQKDDLSSSAGSRTSVQLETQEERPNNLRNLLSLTQHGNTNTSTSREGVLQSSSVEDSQSSIRTSVGSTSSGQRLLNSPAGGDPIIRTQPKRAELNSEELKPLNDDPRVVVAVPGSGGHKGPAKHSNKCESCGRCQCADCSRPRVLPSCWMCGHRCVCSAQNAVEYGTCVCCVKGLFYHCSSDDEDTCADKPFSCTQARCCVRWTTVSLLSLLFPCLLCYLPAKGCVAVCQSCYDRVARPGCRCKNTKPIHYEDVSKQT